MECGQNPEKTPAMLRSGREAVNERPAAAAACGIDGESRRRRGGDEHVLWILDDHEAAEADLLGHVVGV